MALYSHRRSVWRVVGWVVLAVPVALVLAIVGTYVIVSVQNDAVAQGVERELLALPVPADTEAIDSFSQVGRYAGAGNGTEYLGALLIESELPRAEIEVFYAALSAQASEADPDHIHPSVMVLTDPDTGRLPGLLRTEFGSRASLPNHYVVVASAEAPSSLHAQHDFRGH